MSNEATSFILCLKGCDTIAIKDKYIFILLKIVVIKFYCF